MAAPSHISTLDLTQWCYDLMAAARANGGAWTGRLFPQGTSGQARRVLQHDGFEVRPGCRLDDEDYVAVRYVGGGTPAAPQGGS